jgi:peptidylprolyl isomerase
MSIRLPRLLTPMLLLVPVGAQPLPSSGAKAPSTTRPRASGSPGEPAPALVTTASGLKYLDTKVGTGPAPLRGQKVVVHYTGWLSDHGQKGRKFDSSLDRHEPLTIPIGVGKLIKGWDEGLLSMKVGGKRTLLIPAALGYGARGAGRDIPPNADLIFEVELLGVQ